MSSLYCSCHQVQISSLNMIPARNKCVEVYIYIWYLISNVCGYTLDESYHGHHFCTNWVLVERMGSHIGIRS